jgi:hypothetical protein
MQLQHWPTEEQLGDYYPLFLTYCVSWVVAHEFFNGEEWFEALSAFAWKGATELDGVVDMLFFFEMFHYGMPYVNWEASQIITNHRWF